jgi:hypothetical protein
MTMVVRCEQCGATLKVRDDKRGKRAKCPNCQAVVALVDTSQKDNTSEFDDPAFEGSLDAAVAKERSQRASSRVVPAHTQPVATVEPGADEDVFERRLMTARPFVRVVVLIVLLIPVLLASRFTVLQRLLSCFVPLVLTGTYRISAIRGEKFVTRFFFGFYPLAVHRCKLPSVVALNVKYGHVGSGMGTFLLFGPAQVMFGRVFDFLMPAIGGPYQIHLVTAKGRELAAWQGFSDSTFQTTLDTLISMTKAEVRSV